jgi:hypothetical protein
VAGERCRDVFALGRFDPILAYIRRIAVRRDFRWIDTPGLGWLAEGEDSYSMRHTGGGFNFLGARGCECDDS